MKRPNDVNTLIEFQLGESMQRTAHAGQICPDDAQHHGIAIAAPDTVLRECQISQEWKKIVEPMLHDGSRRVEALRATTIAGGFLAALDADARTAAVSSVRELIAVAQRLGATRLTIEPASVSGPSAVRYQDGLNHTFATVRELLPDLERGGVHLCLRAAVNGFLMSPPEMRELLDAFDTAFVGADVDVMHARCDRACAGDWLATLGPRVFLVGLPQEGSARNDASWTREPGDLVNAFIVERDYHSPGV